MDYGVDWIVYGFFDLIVDVFFLIICYVDGVIDDIDLLIIDFMIDFKKMMVYLGFGLGNVMVGIDEDGSERFK